MDAVVIEEGSEPIIGEEDMAAELSATYSDYMSKPDQAIDVPPLFMCRWTSRMKFQTSAQPSGS